MRVMFSVIITAMVGVGSMSVRTEPEEALLLLPVLLVPGWFDTDRELAALKIRLVASGWAGEDIETMGFGSPTGSNRVHAEEIAAAVADLRRRTGADKVDIVAHSMGGLATRWYLLHQQDAPVRRVAFIASPHRGTYSAYLSWGEGRLEMKPASAFLDTLNAATAVPLGTQAITVWTPLDTRIIPVESAKLVGFPDYRVCCPTHAGLLRDTQVFQIVRRFLEDGYEKQR